MKLKPETAPDELVVIPGTGGREILRSEPDRADTVAEQRDELLAACKAWSDYFAELERISTPGDALARAREEYHGPRLRQTRDAIAKCEAAQ